jgi:hypothetical protein
MYTAGPDHEISCRSMSSSKMIVSKIGSGVRADPALFSAILRPEPALKGVEMDLASIPPEPHHLA